MKLSAKGGISRHTINAMHRTCSIRLSFLKSKTERIGEVLSWFEAMSLAVEIVRSRK